DGKRIGYLKFHLMSDRYEVSIETRDLAGGQPTVLISSPLLHDFYWLPDGRVVYSLGDGRATASDNFAPLNGKSLTRLRFWSLTPPSCSEGLAKHTKPFSTE